MKITEFKNRKTNDGRIFLMERGGTAAARIKFLGAVQNLIISGNQSPEFRLNETTQKYIWQVSSRKGSLRVPAEKRTGFLYATGSATTGFIPHSN
jgi:hypothetical protein